MGEVTEISWADGSFNPWWGCSRVSAACRACYAETFAHRLGLDVWGKGNARRFFGDKHWNEPRVWNRKAAAAGLRMRVFCASMADVFEDRPELPAQRARLWDLIAETPWIDWLLLTKRPENVLGMVPWGFMPGCWPDNVWLGTTCEDQACADERIPHLQANPAVVRFLSCEPLLGPLTLDLTGISWVLSGGESGAKARPSHPDWFRSLRDQCQAAGVAYHHKQWGEWIPYEEDPQPPFHASQHGDLIDGHLLPADLTENVPTGGWWWPGGADDPIYRRVGKKVAGRMLDGRLWNEFPHPEVALP